MIRKFINNSINKLYVDEQMRKCFPEGSLLVSHKKAPNLKQILVDQRYNDRNKASSNSGATINNNLNKEIAAEKGVFFCNKKCQMCQNNYLIPGKYFRCTVTKRQYTIKQHLNCNASNVIYLITCNSCQKQYVGSTMNLKARFTLYKSDIRQLKNLAPVFNTLGKFTPGQILKYNPLRKYIIWTG